MNASLPTVSQPRLRNSCDACFSSKVKCSKERPACRRCERRDLFCVYSVSLRSKRVVDPRASSARASHSRENNNAPSNNADDNINISINTNSGGDGVGDGSRDGSIKSRSSRGNSASIQLSSTDGDALGLDTAMAPALDSASSVATFLYDLVSTPQSDVIFDMPMDDLNYLPSPALSNGSVLEPTLAQTTAILARYQQQQLQQQQAQQHCHFGGFPYTPTSTQSQQHDGVPPMTSTPAPMAPPSMKCGCQQSILSKLSELSLASSLFASGSSGVPFDRALSENRAIVALCTSTLNCATCTRSHGMMLVLTLAALLAQMLAVFDGVLAHKRRDKGSCPGAGTDTPCLYGTPDLLTAPVSVGSSLSGDSGPQPQVRLSLGSYQLDERDEQILQTNLLKIELGKITALVEAFEARLARPCGPAGVSDGLMANGLHLLPQKGSNETRLHLDMVGYLKKGLRANYDALKILSDANGQDVFGGRGGAMY